VAQNTYLISLQGVEVSYPRNGHRRAGRTVILNNICLNIGGMLPQSGVPRQRANWPGQHWHPLVAAKRSENTDEGLTQWRASVLAPHQRARGFS
jgi:hypothetical protein